MTMSILSKLARLNCKQLLSVAFERFGGNFPDEIYLKIIFRLRMGYGLNLNDPVTFSEKLQWLKVHNQNSMYTQLVDKFDVKGYVGCLLGDPYIIPTINVWEKPEQIKWDELPERFVLKTTHGGGSSGVIICRDKTKLNKVSAVKALEKTLKQDIYKTFREWPYKNVHKRIIAEKYMEQEDGSELIDYKFFCFHGSPEFLYVRHTDKVTNKKSLCFVTKDWELAPFRRKDDAPVIALPPKPLQFDEMMKIAKRLSSAFPFVRVDLYTINGQVYFSELTFYPSSGLLPFESYESDKTIGKLLDLSKIADYDKK